MHGRVHQQVAAGAALVLLLCGVFCSAAAVSFEPISYQGWTRLLGSLRGQIVVVDAWATWCRPCIERFPHMVAMSRRYQARGVTFVSLSLDNREDKQAIEKARQFVREQHATFRNYLLDENILEAFEMLDIAAVPAVFVYDRSGQLRHKLTGDDPNRQFTEKDVEAAVTALLAESGGA